MHKPNSPHSYTPHQIPIFSNQLLCIKCTCTVPKKNPDFTVDIQNPFCAVVQKNHKSFIFRFF